MTSRLSLSRHLLGLVAAAAAIGIGGCTAGQNYARPVTTAPDQFRGRTADAAANTRSIAEEPWTTVFDDDVLRQLVATALAQNDDVRIAASRIEQVEARYRIARADRFPTVTGQAAAQGQHGTVVNGETLPTAGLVQLGAGLSWELDFWGKYRRATEAARAEIAASEWGRRAIITGLVSEVTSRYYALRSLDLELEISERTLASRLESLRLTDIRERGGVTPLVDVRQAEQLVHTARGQIADARRQIEQSENALSVLLGQNPGPIARGRPLIEQPLTPTVPAGLPSSLLERRPDILQAEQGLVAANARVGAAKAAYFPQISLTAAGGVASTALSNLFTAGTWAVGASLAQPIFNAGRIKSQVALAEAERQERELVYQQTIRQAFREVSDALVGYRRFRELRESQQQVVVAAQDARRLADLRYQGGATSYLEVLDSDTRLFVAELGLVQAQLAEHNAFVEIYRALGGGWTS
jgi:multidrug efflux system outer membrane protein